MQATVIYAGKSETIADFAIRVAERATELQNQHTYEGYAVIQNTIVSIVHMSKSYGDSAVIYYRQESKR